MHSIKYLIKNSFRLLGKRGVFWFFMGTFSSIGISIVELSVSVVIQLLLMSFGFLTTQSNLSYFKFISLPLPVYQVTILLCITALVRFFVQLISTQTATFLWEQVGLRLRQNGVAQMLFSNSTELRSSSLMHFNLSEIFAKSSMCLFYFSLFFSMFVQSAVLFGILYIIAWKEALISTAGIFIIGLIVLFINKKVSNFAKLIPMEQKKLNEGIEKIARNFLFMKLMKKRKDEQNLIQDTITEYASKSVRANFFSNLGSQTGPFLGILLLVCIILVSEHYWHTKTLVLISYIYLLARFVQSLSIMSNYFGNSVIFFPQYKLALESISNKDFEENCVPLNQTLSPFGGRKNGSKIHVHSQLNLPHKNENQIGFSAGNAPSVLFEDMSFGYKDFQPIFSHFNLKIDPGSQVGIMGSSGSGKSTLLFLMAGYLKPNSGQILIDNINAEDYVSQEKIRIGYVGAEPFLFHGSLRENLIYGISFFVSDEDILSVLKMVSLEKLVAEKGLNYKIEEDLSGLSAGQKQRLCLARAILNKPNLLILDEATANLDETNEHQVAEILKELKGKCTTMIVSHRLGILAFADMVLKI